MLLDSLLNSGQRVTDAIRSASQKTGISFDYLLKTAYRESALNPKAQASTSSALGLFQFIDTTWLATVKEDGPAFGLSQYANQIEKSGDQYFVRDPMARAQILKLRENPEIASNMAAAFSKRNAAEIQSVLGRQPTSGELYIAHFLGANGAKRFLHLRATNPNASAASAFPEAARANKSIFYGANGAKTVEETYRGLVAKHDNIRSVAPATVAANLQITNPRAVDENNSPTPNLLNRIAAIFSPRRSAPVNNAAPVQQINTATPFAPNIKQHTRTITVQAPPPPAATQNVIADNQPPQTIASAFIAPQVQNDAPIFRGLFQNEPVTANAPLSQDVRSLWGGVNPFLRRST